MNRKLFSTCLILASCTAVFSGYARAALQHYRRCSVCINGDPADPTPLDTLRECRTWLRWDDNEDFRQIINRSDVDQMLTQSTVRCDDVTIYGAFHANEAYINLPFDISLALAKAYQPSSLTYTGSSCSLFHSVDQLNGYAQRLAQMNSTRFRISGNQDEGIVTSLLPFVGWHEIKRQSSKVSVLIDNGTIRLEYQKCSKPHKACVLDDGPDATTKYCSIEGKVLNQICCPATTGTDQSSPGIAFGIWSVPGKSCDES